MTKLITQLTNKADQDIIQFHIEQMLETGFTQEDILESFKFMFLGNTPEIPLDIHTSNLILTYGKVSVNKTIKSLRKAG